ncbi:MAG TPA: hypothetical protein DCO72_06680 [Ruminococcus sp.]|nr:hypothetical protein [Ruminococcus sp.]
MYQVRHLHFAFITENEYEDYQVTLENQFSVNSNKMFFCEKYHPQEEVVHNYQLAMRVSSGNFLPVPKQAVIGGIVAVIVLIIMILFPK